MTLNLNEVAPSAIERTAEVRSGIQRELDTLQNKAMTEITYLDDSDDLRMLLKDLIRLKLGLDCLGLSSVAELQENEADVLASKVAILDINLGGGKPSGIDAYAWLHQKGFTGTIFFLTGHARYHPLVTQAYDLGAKVIEKPIASAELLAMIQQAVDLKKSFEPSKNGNN